MEPVLNLAEVQTFVLWQHFQAWPVNHSSFHWAAPIGTYLQRTLFLVFHVWLDRVLLVSESWTSHSPCKTIWWYYGVPLRRIRSVLQTQTMVRIVIFLRSSSYSIISAVPPKCSRSGAVKIYSWSWRRVWFDICRKLILEVKNVTETPLVCQQPHQSAHGLCRGDDVVEDYEACLVLSTWLNWYAGRRAHLNTGFWGCGPILSLNNVQHGRYIATVLSFVSCF